MRYIIDNFKGLYNKNNELKYYPEMARYYPLTGGYHTGTDFRCPVNTPIYAPCDGEMIKAEVSTPKGNVGIYSFDYEGVNYGLELCHLIKLPKVGQYKEGEIIAYTGNTGTATTGAHLHVVMHKNTRVSAFYSGVKNANLNKGQKGARDFIDKCLADGTLIDTYKWFTNKLN